MGMGVVFIGLICLVIICEVLHICCNRTPKETEKPAEVSAAATEKIENREELIAAISAVLAEELGTEVSGIRIHSFKRV